MIARSRPCATRVFSVFDRTGEAGVAGEHDFDRIQLDYKGGYSWQERNTGNGKSGAQLTNRISNVGWILDRTQSDLYPDWWRMSRFWIRTVTSAAARSGAPERFPVSFPAPAM